MIDGLRNPGFDLLLAADVRLDRNRPTLRFGALPLRRLRDIVDDNVRSRRGWTQRKAGTGLTNAAALQEPPERSDQY